MEDRTVKDREFWKSALRTWFFSEGKKREIQGEDEIRRVIGLEDGERKCSQRMGLLDIMTPLHPSLPTRSKVVLFDRWSFPLQPERGERSLSTSIKVLCRPSNGHGSAGE